MVRMKRRTNLYALTEVQDEYKGRKMLCMFEVSSEEMKIMEEVELEGKKWLVLCGISLNSEFITKVFYNQLEKIQEHLNSNSDESILGLLFSYTKMVSPEKKEEFLKAGIEEGVLKEKAEEECEEVMDACMLSCISFYYYYIFRMSWLVQKNPYDWRSYFEKRILDVENDAEKTGERLAKEIAKNIVLTMREIDNITLERANKTYLYMGAKGKDMENEIMFCSLLNAEPLDVIKVGKDGKKIVDVTILSKLEFDDTMQAAFARRAADNFLKSYDPESAMNTLDATEVIDLIKKYDKNNKDVQKTMYELYNKSLELVKNAGTTKNYLTLSKKQREKMSLGDFIKKKEEMPIQLTEETDVSETLLDKIDGKYSVYLVQKEKGGQMLAVGSTEKREIGDDISGGTVANMRHFSSKERATLFLTAVNWVMFPNKVLNFEHVFSAADKSSSDGKEGSRALSKIKSEVMAFLEEARLNK